jgi:hypothetical protein
MLIGDKIPALSSIATARPVWFADDCVVNEHFHITIAEQVCPQHGQFCRVGAFGRHV